MVGVRSFRESMKSGGKECKRGDIVDWGLENEEGHLQ